MAEGAAERCAIETPCRRARDHIDDDAQIHLPADFAQHVEIDRLRVIFGASLANGLEEGCLEPRIAVLDGMQGCRGADQLQDLLADPMHVHGQRNAAETNQRDAQLLFPHENSWRMPAR